MAATHQDELQVPRGAVIFDQGDPGHEMFVIAAGRVRLTIGADGHEKEVALLGPGEFFGELSLVNDAPRSATATAIEDSTLLVIGRDAFAMMVQDDLDIVFRMMNTQGQRLSQTNLPIQELTQRLGRARVVAHCLRRLVAPAADPRIDIALLARELDIPLAAAEATVAELVQQNLGARQGNYWNLQGPQQIEHLVEALCCCADGRPYRGAAT